MQPVLRNWQRITSSSSQYYCLTQFYFVLLLQLLLLILLGTICSAEIVSNVKNGQSKSSIGSAAIGSSSFKEMNGIEGSGNGNNMMEWSDDEDLGGEGSGAHGEGSGDMEDVQDQPIVPVITSEDVRQTGSTARLTTTVYTEPTLKTWPATRPPVIGKPPEAGSTDRSTLSVLTAFVIVLWVPLLLC